MYLNLCNNFNLIELYINWIHEPTFLKITKPRFSYKKPWPLDYFLVEEKRQSVRNYLASKSWHLKKMDAVEAEFKQTLLSFSNLLGEKNYLFSESKPCELDALLFGHLYTLLTTRGIDNRFADSINEFTNLVDFLRRLEEFATVGSRK